MSYEKMNLENEDVLFAEHIAHMEDGISELTDINHIGRINVLDYGFVADGVTDNSDAMDAILADYNLYSKELYFPFINDTITNDSLWYDKDRCTYCFSRPIHFQYAMRVRLGSKVELKYIGEETELCSDGETRETRHFIDFNWLNVRWQPLSCNYITSDGFGYLNGNDKVLDIFAPRHNRETMISNLFIQNFLRSGIHMGDIPEPSEVLGQEQVASSAHCSLMNLEIFNANVNKTEEAEDGWTYGILDEGNDAQIMRITVKDTRVGIKTRSARTTMLHHWISRQALARKAISFWVNGFACIFDSCCADTVRFPIWCEDDSYGGLFTNFSVMWNMSVYGEIDTSDLTKDVPILFGAPFDSNSSATNATSFAAGNNACHKISGLVITHCLPIIVALTNPVNISMCNIRIAHTVSPYPAMYRSAFLVENVPNFMHSWRSMTSYSTTPVGTGAFYATKNQLTWLPTENTSSATGVVQFQSDAFKTLQFVITPDGELCYRHADTYKSSDKMPWYRLKGEEVYFDADGEVTS